MSIEQLPELTPEAQRFWESIPAEIRPQLLSNVLCVHCGDEVTITHITGRIVAGDLILIGSCAVCGESLARAIEAPDL